MSTRRSQRQAILNMLLANRGREVPSYELAKYALQYCSRVSELRKLGFVIKNRVERVNGEAHGFFKLEWGMAQVTDKKPVTGITSKPTNPTKPKTEGESLSLFGDLAPLPKYPD